MDMSGTRPGHVQDVSWTLHDSRVIKGGQGTPVGHPRDMSQGTTQRTVLLLLEVCLEQRKQLSMFSIAIYFNLHSFVYPPAGLVVSTQSNIFAITDS